MYLQTIFSLNIGTYTILYLQTITYFSTYLIIYTGTGTYFNLILSTKTGSIFLLPFYITNFSLSRMLSMFSASSIPIIYLTSFLIPDPEFTESMLPSFIFFNFDSLLFQLWLHLPLTLVSSVYSPSPVNYLFPIK